MMDNEISHDQITRFLSKNKFDSKELWLKVKKTVREIESQDACLMEGGIIPIVTQIKEWDKIGNQRWN